MVLVIFPLVLNRLQNLSPVLLQLGVGRRLRAPLLVVEDARVRLVQVDAVQVRRGADGVGGGVRDKGKDVGADIEAAERAEAPVCLDGCDLAVVV